MEEEENLFKTLNKKVNNLSNGKKIVLLLCLLVIFCAVYYMTTVDTIQTFQYIENHVVVCEEIYVNGIINTTPCPQNTDYYPKKRFSSDDYNDSIN
jgi:hypothetical protein